MAKGKTLADHESGHWVGWGPLLSKRGKLVNLGDLVRVLCTDASNPLPLRPAAGQVLAALAEHEDAAVFITQPATWAVEARADWPVLRAGVAGKAAWVQYNTGTNRATGQRRPPIHHPARAEVAQLAGRSGLLAMLRQTWRQAKVPADLYRVEFFGGQLAILWADAVVLFPNCMPAGPDAVAADLVPEVVPIARARRARVASAPAPAAPAQPVHQVASVSEQVPWTNQRIADRLQELKDDIPARKAPKKDLLTEMGLPYNDTTRQRITRAVKDHKAATEPATLVGWAAAGAKASLAKRQR